MRIALLYITFFTMAGCTPIDNLVPNQTNTFLKFYSESSTMESKDLIVLNDGYLILSNYTDSTALVLKTDLLGNKLWATAFINFTGSSVTETNDGYIIIGDSINTLDGSTYMQLINTSKIDGSKTGTAFIGTGAEHGAAITFTENEEIIGLGYTADALGDSIILMSYNSNLATIWPTPRKYLSELAGQSIYEDNGLITWLSYYSNQKKVSVTTVLHDNEGNESNPTVFNLQTLSNTKGDITKTPGGYAVVQSITLANGETKIGYASLINGNIDTESIIASGEFENGNYKGYTLTNTLNGLLIAATTNNPDEDARTDVDLLLLEVDINGNLVSGGINQTFGGVGDEIPVRIRKTADGGYAILGTSTNSKGAQQSFLLKTNSKGLLN